MEKTAVLLMKSVTETYNKILPEESLIIYFIVDGGANYNKASEIIIDEENINCFAHTLQFPINKIISPSKNKNKYQICITEVRNLMKKVKYTPTLLEDFESNSFPLDAPDGLVHILCVNNLIKIDTFIIKLLKS